MLSERRAVREREILPYLIHTKDNFAQNDININNCICSWCAGSTYWQLGQRRGNDTTDHNSRH
jgi:hypothetical protein